VRRLATSIAVAFATLVVLAVAYGVVGRGASPVYALSVLRAHLAQDQATWVDRPLWVRGMVEPCPWWEATARVRRCAGASLVLVAGLADQVAAPLPLRPKAPNALLAVLRGVPILRDLVAPSRAVPVFAPACFHVQVHRLPAQACGGSSPCYAAVLLDGVP
jgi:hypothetical protein